jgi:HEAT repeat protein
LEKDAERLAADASPQGPVARLAAVELLRGHKSPAAVRLLQRLARNPGAAAEPAVAAPAAARLIEIDPDQALPAAADLLASPDAVVRGRGVQVLFLRPNEDRIRLLADQLNDVHPDVRRQARQDLKELADKRGFRDRVVAEAARVLGEPGQDPVQAQWQGLEQAAILLAQLGRKEVAPRLVELLGRDRPEGQPRDRPEVFVAAAWGLRKLDVPATLPAVARHVRSELKWLVKGKSGRSNFWRAMEDHKLSQLNQLLGRRRYAPAEPTLRDFVKKRPGRVGPECRAAAIWALGLIHEGKPDPKLVPALQERLRDLRAIPPEDERVRRMSAVTLGRMKAKSAADDLEEMARLSPGWPVRSACRWAVAQIRGTGWRPAAPVHRGWRDWFLVPDE